MTKQVDIKRFEKGRDHWNDWAEKQLLLKEKLVADGDWKLDQHGNGINTKTQQWIEKSRVDFRAYEFLKDVEFQYYVFPHDVDFQYATFRHAALFYGCKFEGKADFSEVRFHLSADFHYSVFKQDAHFTRAIFCVRSINFHKVSFLKMAWFGEIIFVLPDHDGRRSEDNHSRFSQATSFIEAQFLEKAWFVRAIFGGEVKFDECEFEGSAVYADAKFHRLVSFRSASSRGPFSISGARFDAAPDFIQMRFRAEVRIDELKIVEAKPFLRSGDKDRAARYRALKSMAILTHDFVQEQKLFKRLPADAGRFV